MGVFYDYYRAEDRRSAVAYPDEPRVVENRPPGTPDFDGVGTKWIDPNLVLGRLIAFARGVPYSSDLVETVPLYPPPENAPATLEERDRLPEDSPYKEGSSIEEIPQDVRDTLADIPDDRLTELAGKWAQIEEFISPPDREGLMTLIRELRDLARRARKDDQMIYCWMCL